MLTICNNNVVTNSNDTLQLVIYDVMMTEFF